MKKKSKILILTRAVLIAILIASLAILIYYKMENNSKDPSKLDDEAKSAFNSKITLYLGENITGSQINSLLAFTLANNMESIQNNENYKCITITSNGGSSTLINENSTTYTKVSTNENSYIVIGTYDENGLLTKIDITKNN